MSDSESDEPAQAGMGVPTELEATLTSANQRRQLGRTP